MVPQTLEKMLTSMKKYIITILLALTTLSPLYAKKEKGQQVIYCIPKTVITVTVESMEQDIKAGPYSHYSKSLLGIDYIEKDSTHFSISKISISASTEADHSKRYSINLTPEHRDEFRMLLDAGYICQSRESATHDISNAESFPVKEVSLEKNEKKSFESAKKAAAQIAKYREDRYDIVTGNTDATYSGEALRSAVEELNKAEEKLLALFSPTVHSFGQSVSFDFIPSAQTSGKIEAFCFSESLGVLPAGSPEGTPYYLEISTDANCVLNAARPDTANGQTIYYCVPSVCNVKIYYYDHVVCHLRVPVYQLGVNEMLNF